MKTTLLSLKAFFTICLLCLVGGVSASAQNTYTKVTSEDQLVAGGIYVIVNENYKVAMSWQDNSNRRAISIEINNNSFTLADADIANAETDKTVYEFQLGGETGKWTFYDKINNGYLFAPGISKKNHLKTQKTIDAKSQAKISFDAKGNSSIVFSAPNANTLRFNDNNHSTNPEKNQQLFACYISGKQQPVQLYRKVDSFPLTTAQYGTYYTEDAYVMPEGVTGYTITSEDGKTLKFNEAYVADAVVPAKTALVLKATEELTANKEYTYTIVNSDAAAPANNLLHGSVAEAMTSVKDATAYYKLAQGEDGLGFYYGAENGGEFKNGAHKAYLAVKTEILSQMRGFSFDSMTTGINHIVANAEHAKTTVIYDLNGRRVNSLNAAAKGIYIVNGKKVIVK